MNRSSPRVAGDKPAVEKHAGDTRAISPSAESLAAAEPLATGVALRVVPNARTTEVVGLHGEALKVKVASPALEGKANAVLLDFVAKTAGVPGRAAVLVAGVKSRDKVVRVEGMLAAELRDKLLGEKEI